MDDIIKTLVSACPLSFLYVNRQLHRLALFRLSQPDYWSDVKVDNTTTVDDIAKILAKSHRYMDKDQRFELRKHFSGTFVMEYEDPFTSPPSSRTLDKYLRDHVMEVENAICPVCNRVAEVHEEGYNCWTDEADEWHLFTECRLCGRCMAIVSWQSSDCDACSTFSSQSSGPAFHHLPSDGQSYYHDNEESSHNAHLWEWRCPACLTTEITHLD